MIDIYLKNDKPNEEDSYNVITMDNVDDAKYSDDEKYLILFSADDENSVVLHESGRFKNTNIIGYFIYPF